MPPRSVVLEKPRAGSKLGLRLGNKGKGGLGVSVLEVAPASPGRPPMEMQPMRATPAAEDDQVVHRGDADRGESGSGGEVRRRTRRAPAAGSD